MAEKTTKPAETKTEEPKEPAMASMDLDRKYTINGKTYGPGTVEVSPEIKETLAQLEKTRLQYEANLHRDNGVTFNKGYVAG